MASTAPIGGLIEIRIRDLTNEVFEPKDMAASVVSPVLKARSAAFLILSHAEIEYSLELECRRTASLLRGAAEPVTAMLAWGFASLRPDGNVIKKKGKAPLDELVDVYQNVVTANNGIKERNLESLLWPLGVDLSLVKTDILALDEFGARRGDLAHQPLSNWQTKDLPSVHVRSGIQAGRSADQIILAIRNGHSRIAHVTTHQLRAVRAIRRTVARALKHVAKVIETD